MKEFPSLGVSGNSGGRTHVLIAWQPPWERPLSGGMGGSCVPDPPQSHRGADPEQDQSLINSQVGERGEFRQTSRWGEPGASFEVAKFGVTSGSSKNTKRPQNTGGEKRAAVPAGGPIASPAAARLFLGSQDHLFHYTIS